MRKVGDPVEGGADAPRYAVSMDGMAGQGANFTVGAHSPS
jgi:hypothetical protein